MTSQTTIAIISPNSAVHEHIPAALSKLPEVDRLWSTRAYPQTGQLDPLRSGECGFVVFLDFSDPMRARPIAAELDRDFPQVAVIAVVSSTTAVDVVELMHLGIREVLQLPGAVDQTVLAFRRAYRKLEQRTDALNQQASIFAFLPARPGCGATTIACNSAAAAARLSSQRTLLIDFDLRLGMTSFLFKLTGEQSVREALLYSEQMDDAGWARIIAKRGPLDILGSAPIHFDRPFSEHGSAAVLRFAAQKYGTICVDLPGEMRDQELETISRAAEVFLVTTPELGAIHMAKRKVEMLQMLGGKASCSVILNSLRERNSISAASIEDILKLPVRFTVPCAQHEIQVATQRAVAIQGHSPLAAQLERIARRMTPRGAPPPTASKTRRFIEFFSVTPVRDRVTWE